MPIPCHINISGAGGGLLNSRNGEDCRYYTYGNILHNSLCCIRRLSSCGDNKISSREEQPSANRRKGNISYRHNN